VLAQVVAREAEDRSPGNIDTAVIDGWRRPQRAGSAVSPRRGARR